MAEEQTKKRRRIWPVVLTAALVLIISTALYLLFTPLDLTRFNDRIEASIESRANAEINIAKIILKTLPSPELTLEGVNVRKKSGGAGKDLLKADRVYARLSLMPLFSGEYIIQEADFDGLRLYVRKQKNGKTDIEEALPGEEKPQAEKEKKNKIVVKSLNVNRGYLNLVDETPASPVTYEFKNINAFLYGDNNNFTYRAEGKLLPASPLSLSGSGKFDTKEVKGRAEAADLDLSRFVPYAESAGLASLRGLLNTSFSYDIGNEKRFDGIVRYAGLEADYPRFFDNPVSSGKGSAGVSLKSNENRLDIHLDKINIYIGGFLLSGSFKLEGPEKARLFTIDASTTPMPVEKLKSLIPMKALPENTSAVITNIAPSGGAITVDELFVAGFTDEIKNKELFKSPDSLKLALSFDDVVFNYKGFKKTFTGISGRVLLKEKVLSVSGFQGRYSKEEIKNLEGTLKDLAGRMDYDVTLTGSADINETLGIARDISAKKSALSRKLGKINASGRVDLMLKLKGAVKGKTPIAYAGQASVREGRLSYEGLPLALEALGGNFAFDNKRITLKDVSGSDGASTLNLNGYLEDYRNGDPFFELEGSGAFKGETVRKFLKKDPEDLFLDGHVDINATAIGRKGNFFAKVSADTTPAAIEYKELIKKVSGYPLTLEGSGRLEGKDISLKGANLKFGSSAINASGRFSLGAPAYDVFISSEQIRLTDLDNVSPFLIREYESEGALSASLNASKESKESKTVIIGAAILKDGRFKTPAFAKPVERVNASARFDGNSAKITIDGLAIGNTEASGRLDILDIAEKAVKFEAFSPRLYMEDIEPPEKTEEEKAKEEEEKKKEEEEEKEKGPRKKVTGTGAVRIKEGIFSKIPYTNFSTEIKLENDAIYFKPLSFDTYGGRVWGDFTQFRDPSSPLKFSTNLSLRDINLDILIAGLGSKQRMLTGDIGGNLTLSESRDAEPSASGLNGKFMLDSNKGRLWKFPVFTNIFSIVNIVGLDDLFKEGLPYDNLSGEFAVKNGIISTDTLWFDSDAMRMSAVGEINIPEKTIDSVLAIHPFVTLDKIISKIPLAGWIITGKEKSTVSMYFNIEGPLNKPDVEPVPVKSLSESIFGIFERLLRTPEKLLKEPEKLLAP